MDLKEIGSRQRKCFVERSGTDTEHRLLKEQKVLTHMKYVSNEYKYGVMKHETGDIHRKESGKNLVNCTLSDQ